MPPGRERERVTWMRSAASGVPAAGAEEGVEGDSLTAIEEDNSFGKMPYQEPSPTRWEHVSKQGFGKTRYTWHYMAAGYAAVWATENTRAAYPLTHLNNIVRSGLGGQPKNIFMLTCDAFGVLPPIARLTPEQAAYHFLSGYTAKVAGTERGMGNEPQVTFSTCFGAPFMALPAEVYARLFREMVDRHKVNIFYTAPTAIRVISNRPISCTAVPANRAGSAARRSGKSGRGSAQPFIA